jgi:hypothetical protein
LNIDECIEIFELPNNQISIIIQPNPTKGVFAISIKNAECKTVDINIHDITGKSLLKDKLANTDKISKDYDLSSYQKGVYFIEVICGDIRKTEKLLIK